MTAKDIMYGRVAPIPKSWQYEREKRQYSVMVKIVFSLANFKPNYAYVENHLRVETNKEIYKIYNPQSLRFSFPLLISHIRTIMRQWDEEIISIQVISASGQIEYQSS